MEYPLNSTHLQEVQKFVNFFEAKRKESIFYINSSFQQCLEKKINDDILSKSEVETLINDLRDEIKLTVDLELQNIVYMSGVYVKILMSQAESNNIILQADTSFIENEKAIEEMKNLGNYERDLNKKSQGGRLPTLQAGIALDNNLAARVKELAEEKEVMRKQIIDQRNKITEILEELNKHKGIKSESNYETEVKEVSQALEETKVTQYIA